jgi:hypothetical protein
MDKFLEEIDNGDLFILNNKKFLLSSDFRKNGDKLCIEIGTGNSKWLKPNSHIELLDLYSIDKNNNFMPIKERKSDVSNSTQNKNIP